MLAWGAMIRSATYPSLEDRVVFVTGGGSGIGASIVEHFCAQRARVAFVDIQREASTALVAALGARGPRSRHHADPVLDLHAGDCITP